LGLQGLRVSKPKLQFVEEKVKYLGHFISTGKCRMCPERIEGITGIPLPETKRELWKFLWLIGYCNLRIGSYSFRTTTLYSRLLEGEPNSLCWEPEEVQIIGSHKQSLITAPVLALLLSEKPFHLFVNVGKGTTLGSSPRNVEERNNL
jgi:hypothetical protein